MKEEYKSPRSLLIIAGLVSFIGFAILITGLLNDPERAWANYLLNNYYFLSLAIGAAFFMTIQYITQSGWSAAFKRIPEAMMAWFPFAAVFFLLIYFGIHSLYHWSHPDLVSTDSVIAHKSAYLNVPFFYIRLILYFSLWIVLTRVLRFYSIKEDLNGGLKYFQKSHFYSKVLIFVLAFTFLLSSIDWIMSLKPHWYSTIFAAKNFVSAFLHGVSAIILIIFFLHGKGYFPFLNKYHVHDFSRYIFILAIIWGYLWFAQFMIIWYGNIPEETSYFYIRWQGNWKLLFFAEIIINWAVPFVVLLPVFASRSKTILSIVCLILIPGQYLEQYLQIMPEVTGDIQFGILEAGSFLAFTGLFVLVTSIALGKAKLIPVNHPYLVESLEHHF